MKNLLLVLALCFITSNYYAQWNQTTVNHSVVGANIVDINFVNNSLGYALMNSNNCNVIETIDGGASWNNVPGIFGCFNRIQFINRIQGYVLGSTSLVYIPNNFTSPSQLLTPAPFESFRDFHFTSNSIGYVAGNLSFSNTGLIHKTTNAGNSFTTDTLQMVSISSIYFQSPDTGFVTGSDLNGDGLIFRTVDAGATWIRTSISSIGRIIDISFVNNNIGYAVGIAGSVDIIKTLDGGVTWNPVTTLNPNNSGVLLSVSFTHQDTGYTVGTMNRAIMTTDGGQNWQDLTLNGTLNKVIFPSSNNGFIVGDDGNRAVLLRNSFQVTDIEEIINKSNTLIVHPNPANETFKTNLEDIKEIIIYNSIGKPVIIKSSFLDEDFVDISNLPSGVYLVQVKDQSNIVYKTKLVTRR